MVHQHLKKAKRRQARYADKNSHYTEFQVGDHVYLKQQQHKSKLQGWWYPYYRIIMKTTPVTCHLKNQLDGTISKADVEHLQLAQLDVGEIPKDKKGRPACKVTYTVPVNSSSDESDIESSDKEESLTKIVKKYQKQREASSDEDDIPLMELAKRMQEEERTDKLGDDDTLAED